MESVILNYSLSKFVMEEAKKLGKRYPPKTIYGMICAIRRFLENGGDALNPLENSDRRRGIKQKKEQSFFIDRVSGKKEKNERMKASWMRRAREN